MKFTVLKVIIPIGKLFGLLPLVWAVVRNRPEDMGLRPYGSEPSNGQTDLPTSQTPEGIALSTALRQPQTWKLVYLGFT